MSTENSEVAKTKAEALQKCEEFDVKYFNRGKSIEFALKKLQNSNNFVNIVNEPMLERFFANNSKRGDRVFETGFHHAISQIPVALMTVANIRNLICLIDLTWDAMDANPSSVYDPRTRYGIPIDFQVPPFFGEKFKNQDELDAAFAGQLNSIKAIYKIKEINDLKNIDDLVAYYETNGKFGLEAEGKKEKKSGIRGDKGRTKNIFSKAVIDGIKSCIVNKGCTVQDNSPNSITAIGKDKKEVCTVTPNEVVVSGTSETDYKLAILLALINFPGQKLIFDYVSAEEKPKFEKAFGEAMKEFKETHRDAKDDIKYVFENEVSKKSDKSSEKVTELEKKYPEVVHDVRNRSLTGGSGNVWYYTDEVRDIISATEHAAGQKGHCRLPANRDNVTRFENEIAENKKFYRSLENLNMDSCSNSVKSGMSELLAAWNKKHPDKNDIGTFVFASHIGGNHFAAYACNTNGEILAINSMGGRYADLDNEAIKGLQAALKENGINSQKPIRITPGPDEQQDGSICGAIAAAMSVAISSDSSFRDQEESLRNQMSKLCGKNTNHYPEIRKEHQMLLNIYKKAIEPRESTMKKEGEEDIRDFLEKCKYHKPNVHEATLSSNRRMSI